MKKWTVLVLVAALVPAFVASAQLNPFKKKSQQLKAANLKPQVDLSAQPASAPVDELNVTELLLKRKDLQGKVVELEFDRVLELKQTGNGYTARVTFESARSGEGLILLIPAEGIELFEEMTDRDFRSRLRKTVYVELLGGDVTRAVGTRYSKNKPDGERYSW